MQKSKFTLEGEQKATQVTLIDRTVDLNQYVYFYIHRGYLHPQNDILSGSLVIFLSLDLLRYTVSNIVIFQRTQNHKLNHMPMCTVYQFVFYLFALNQSFSHAISLVLKQHCSGYIICLFRMFIKINQRISNSLM